MDPIQLFNKWYQEELNNSNFNIPSACCLSTMGLDDYPNARFVSLKELINEQFIITGPLNSRKGIEILKSNKIALSFWWAATEKQVRVQGDATNIPDELADKYFKERSLESQVVSLVSRQGIELENIELLKVEFNNTLIKCAGKVIPRPGDWGGYAIKPLRIEFLKFNKTRLHERILFERRNDQWIVRYLQP